MRYIVTPKLNELLKERGMTQVDLSKITGIGQGTISRFDKNKQHKDVHLVTIASALDVKIEDLFYIFEVDEANEKLITE
ncbi:helix-turn-helix domain-containing protein [Halalkalibacter oceani]|uniref:helix-turn-helix domain-containing protein n=1 Tax=Halalkalibacter oceani TaxID=1653776 RepID=UPI003395CA94